MQPISQKKPASIEELASGQFQLPSLPVIVVELIDTLNDEKIGFPHLVEKIAKDQSLVARVMRLANSPFYGFSGSVASIREAVALLGFNNVRNLVLTSTLMDLFPGPGGAFDWAEFWRHSFNTGACAKLLAAKVRQNQEAAFLAGILHDIGRLLIGVYLPGQFATSLAYQREHGVALIEVERALWGTDHARIGADAARRWRLPAAICHAIEHHRTPEPSSGMPLTDIVYLANALDQELAASAPELALSEFLAEEAHRRLGLDRTTLTQLAGQVAANALPPPG